MRFAQDATDAGKLLGQFLGWRLFFFNVIGRVKLVDKGRARYFEQNWLFESNLESIFLVAERKGRVVSGRARQEEFGRVKTSEVFFRRCGLGFAVGHVLAIRIDVERQQHRYRAFADIGKSFFADGVEAGESFGRRLGAAIGQARRGSFPIDVTELDDRAFQFARGRRPDNKQCKAYQDSAFHTGSLVLPASQGPEKFFAAKLMASESGIQGLPV